MKTRRQQPPVPDSRSEATGTPRTIDVPAGPPNQAAHDQAAHRLAAEQAGLADAAAHIYDQFSFLPGITALYIRDLRADVHALIERAKTEEVDDTEIADEFVRAAQRAKKSAEVDHRAATDRRDRARNDRDYHRRVLLGEDPTTGNAWRAPHRIGEPPWVGRAWSIGIPAIGLVIEIPWSYYALQVLGEPDAATFAMAVVFGWAGVLLAHLAGVQARHARAGARTARYGAVAACVAALGVVGAFLAAVRTAALAAPIITKTGKRLPSGLELYHLHRATVFAGWIAVNLGMWLAVGLLAHLHHNPHVIAHHRANTTATTTETETDRAETELADADAAVNNTLTRRTNCHLKWATYRDSLNNLAEQLEAIYFRALATGTADPNFTTAIEAHLDQAPDQDTPPPAQQTLHENTVTDKAKSA